MTRSASIAVAGVALAIALVGCFPVVEPTAPPTPSVVEVPRIDGASVSLSDLESDSWVVAARAADLGYILAVNNHDFSIAQFTSTRPDWLAERQYESWVRSNTGDGESPFVYPGPSVLLPLSVTETSDGADVTFCDASALWLDGGADEAAALADGRVAVFSMELDGAGAAILTDRVGSTEVCDATGAPIGRFDPQPVAPDSLQADEVRGPIAQ